MNSCVTIRCNGQAELNLADAALVEVHERMGATTTFRIDYDLQVRDGDIPLLTEACLDPGSKLAIITTVNGQDECLVRGPVHSQDIHLKHGGGGSTLSVHGSDTTVIMEREPRIKQMVEGKDSDMVANIFSSYEYKADIEETAGGHFEKKHTLIQRGDDLRFVRRLARRNGYLFWVTCAADGITETAHFRPPPLDNLVETKLVINQDSPGIEAFDISWDVEGRPTSVVGSQLDLNSKGEQDGDVVEMPVAVLGDRSLQQITGDTRSILLQAPVDDTGDLQARGQGALTEANWFIRATCETSAHALRGILRAHTVVEVCGAGRRHSGPYFVSEVRHLIDVSAHRMEVTLLRNGWSK